MIRSLKVATAVAVISVGGLAASGVALGADPPNVGEDWAFFSGKALANGKPLSGELQAYEENGLFITVGGDGFTGQTMTTDDPRMTGTRSEYTNGYANGKDSATAAMIADLIVIENADGSWTCPSYGVVMDPGDTDPGAGWALSGWCEGAGAYEGLRAFVRWDTTPGNMWFDVHGFITSGDPPPMGEVPEN